MVFMGAKIECYAFNYVIWLENYKHAGIALVYKNLRSHPNEIGKLDGSHVRVFSERFFRSKEDKPCIFRSFPWSQYWTDSHGVFYFIYIPDFLKTLVENLEKLLLLVLGTTWGCYGQNFSLIARTCVSRPNLANMHWTSWHLNNSIGNCDMSRVCDSELLM